MTDALIQENILITNTADNTAIGNNALSFDTDGDIAQAFSNLMNIMNANIEQEQTNFIDLAIKSNTSSINQYVLKKFQNNEEQSTEIEPNADTRLSQEANKELLTTAIDTIDESTNELSPVFFNQTEKDLTKLQKSCPDEEKALLAFEAYMPEIQNNAFSLGSSENMVQNSEIYAENIDDEFVAISNSVGQLQNEIQDISSAFEFQEIFTTLNDELSSLKTVYESLDNNFTESADVENFEKVVEIIEASNQDLSENKNNENFLKQEGLFTIKNNSDEASTIELSENDLKKLEEIASKLNNSADFDEILNLFSNLKQNDKLSSDTKLVINDIVSGISSINEEAIVSSAGQKINKDDISKLKTKIESALKAIKQEADITDLNIKQGTDSNTLKPITNSSDNDTISEILDMNNSQIDEIQYENYDSPEDFIKAQARLSVSDEVVKLAMEEQNSIGQTNNLASDINPVAHLNSDTFKGQIGENQIQTPKTASLFSKNMETDFSKYDILNQIGDKLTKLQDGVNHKLTMVLRPNDLGRLSIELTTNNLGLSANIVAQNDDVKAYIEKNINILRQQLADSGVNVNNIRIASVDSTSSTNYDGSSEFSDNKNNQEFNQKEEQNQRQNQEQNQKEKRDTLANLSNYDLHFAKDFSSILNKTLNYSL